MAFTKSSLTTSFLSTTKTSYPKHLIFFFFLLLTFPLFLFLVVFPSPQFLDVIKLETEPHGSSVPPSDTVEVPKWLEVIRRSHIANEKPLKLGLINFKDIEPFNLLRQHGVIDYVNISLESVSPKITWKSIFPEWIDENKPYGQCPEIPMPEAGKYSGLNVVVTKLPCEEIKRRQFEYNNGTKKNGGFRDVERVQLSLASARLTVENINGRKDEDDVYAVFVGKCEPMVEIFRCDDLVWHKGKHWVYKPKVEKLREKISMPVGACDLSLPNSYKGISLLEGDSDEVLKLQTREAYVTMLHSSEDYVCGAIALAQSILETNTTKDLVLLADRTISNHSLEGLEAAGWKITRIDRIHSPNARIDAYNEWNYSKLRVWQLTEYDKVMFIDADFIVLRNIDHFFDFPQLSAAPNSKWIFNSGIMILEPSECFFDYLMTKRYKLKSYNGGDQGYLNEVFTWWHRLTKSLNFMKYFGDKKEEDRLVLEDRYTIHFLGKKPWVGYRDYDCNWDIKGFQVFASDAVNARWWRVYDAMTLKLQTYCAMTEKNDLNIRKRRERAQKLNLSNGHWRIQIKDPRQYNLVNPHKKQNGI